ncbi:acetyltransferase [Anoxybacterium hadale]|uniref:Acetyltransferase n=2 Tax=Anoxybacterium hadale TaxID=3408580 RepID=A0ACD1AGX7_9FIRM|nr:acetyltransferase [Clostridiales bacterium]
MPGLDGLRALAVFAVIAYHLDLSWAPGGLLGVSLFFVLSGYLITNILMKQWERTGTIDLKDFWIRRARRLLPALFVMLTGVILWAAFFSSERLADLLQEVLAAAFYTSNWYLIFHQVSYFESFGPPSPLGHLWSLAVEEQFYLFWPLLLGLGLRCTRQRKWIIGGTAVIALASAAAMALIYMPGHDPSRVYYGTDTRAFGLLVGAVLAMVWPSGQTGELTAKKRLALETTGSMGLLVVILMIITTNQYQTSLYQGGLLIFSAAAACAVAALAHPGTGLGRLLGWRPLRWLGECSYGIYLWHYPVIVLTSPLINTEGPDLLLQLRQIALSIFLAVLSRYLVEDPIRYGRGIGISRLVPGLRHFAEQAKAGKSRLAARPLLLSAKISVSVLLICFVFLMTANGGGQISAEDLISGHVATNIPITQERIDPSKDLADSDALEQQPHENDPTVPVKQGAGMDSIEKPSGENSNTEGAEQENPSNKAEGESYIVNGTKTASQGENEVNTEKETIKGEGITAIGDSLMIGIEPYLQKRMPGAIVDGKIGRQMHQAPDVISGLEKEGKLGKTVIIELGSNGSFTEKQLANTLDSLKCAEQIILMNTRVPRPWETAVNDTIGKVAQSYPNVKLIDWYSASNGHNEYFYSDGVHLNQKGAEAYGNLIVEALSAVQEQETSK